MNPNLLPGLPPKSLKPSSAFNPKEFKIQTLRECPTPVELQLCDTPDKAAWLRTNRGTQRGAYMGVPASNRAIVWHDIIVTRYEGSKVVEEWGVSDLGEKLRTP